MRIPAVEKVAFVVSLSFLAFLYGIATQAFGWFPSDFLRRAWNQAEAVNPFHSAGSGTQPWGLEARIYDRQGARIVRPREMQPGLTLLTSTWESVDGWVPGLRLIEPDGEIVHQWWVDPARIFQDTVDMPLPNLRDHDIQGTYLFPDGDILVNIEYVGVARLDACGRVLWRRSGNNYHHSIARDDDGAFWIPGVLRDMPASSATYAQGYPGLDGPIHQDLIVKLNEDGEILETINVLDLLYDNGLERMIPHARLDRDTKRNYMMDVVHLNDIEPLSRAMADQYPLFDAGDLAVSFRDVSLVLVFDPRSRKVKWHAHLPFIHQHDADFTGNGWVGVFDNNHDHTERGTMLGGSRIVLLEPNTDSVQVVFPTPQSEPFYTAHRGKWQLLDNGNLLLSESAAGRVVEVDTLGQTVWEWVNRPASDSTVYAVTDAERLDLTGGETLDWPCSGTDTSSDPVRSR